MAVRHSAVHHQPVDPPEGLFALAVGLYQSGALDGAAQACRSILAGAPRHAPSFNLLGGIAATQSDLPQAIRHLGKAVAYAPLEPDYHYNHGVFLAAGGQPLAAEAAYRQALGVQPQHLGARYNLGNLLAARADYAAAAACYRQLLSAAPDHVNALVNLGAVLSQLNQPAGAIGCYRRALALDPKLANAHYNLGKLLQEQGHPDEALPCYRAALTINPTFTEALLNLGNALAALARLDEAAACFASLLQSAPDSAEVQVSFAELLRQQHRLEPALKACDAALRHDRHVALAHEKRGYILYGLGRPADGNAALAQAIALAPERPSAHSGLIMSLHYQPGATEADILRAAQNFGASLPAGPRPRGAAAAGSGARRLRIGYVSGDFKHHAVGFFLEPVLAHHNHNHFEIFAYSNAPGGDWMTDQLRPYVRWRNISALPDAQAAALIAADGIDLLIDLSGHTGLNRLAMFARRPAPVQLSWLGFWGTTGLPAMDYILSDQTMIRPAEDALYTERVVRLPVARFCYAPPSYAPEVAPPPCLDGSPVTFGSFGNPEKLNPRVIALWSALLRRLPAAQLLLKWATLAEPGHVARLSAAFAARGVGRSRLILRGASAHPDMLAEYADVDIALDPFPFSGGLTSCEALWMGVPVITLPGARAVSRQTQTMLHAIGEESLIATGERDYLQRAAALAADPQRLTALRARLRPRLAASALCDGANFTKGLESAFRTIWRDFCATSQAG
jgi:predicted O-linked N-acetylglucosamine transferase (SPINDLY family)